MVKLQKVGGSGIGHHPCAGSGIKVIPETEKEMWQLVWILERWQDDYPEAIRGNYDGDKLESLFLPNCCTHHRTGYPSCGGAPKGALVVLHDVLGLIATR